MIYCSFFGKNVSSRNKNFKHNIAHSLLAHGLFVEYSILYKKEKVDYGKNGKPFLVEHPEIHFNLSHCDGCAVCAIDTSPVGIDVENIRSFNEKTAKRVCTESELEFINSSASPESSFFKLWTLKESIVKNTGTGITIPLRQFDFSIFSDNTVKCNHDEFVFDLIEYGNFVISVCKTR